MFIEVIDAWADRLKRNFNFYYQGSRRSAVLGQDYAEQMRNAPWRKK